MLRGKQPKPLSFAYFGQGIAPGRGNGIGFNTYPDEKAANRPYFTGQLAYQTREYGARCLANLPRLERRWPGFFVWVGKGRYAAAQRRRASQAQTIGRLFDEKTGASPSVVEVPSK